MWQAVCAVIALLCTAATSWAEERAFSHFSADLPAGWDCGEKQDFKVGDGQGYMLVCTCPTADGEGVAAHMSLYLLPNIHKDSAAEHAGKLAALQANATPPRQEGVFWQFTGEPKSQSITAPAVTRVNVTPEKTLIIITQDPENRGAEHVVSSLRGISPEARALLAQ